MAGDTHVSTAVSIVFPVLGVTTRDLNCGRGRVFGRVAFVAVANIMDAIAVTA
ncbi:hypothetical protein Goshw_013761, partial [Gossypium schwendimanii]|nr:hypothetical protein [Gossypium schwendimanii]